MRATARSRLLICVGLAAAGWSAACGNAGDNRVLAIESTGTLQGLVYLDRNGNRVPDAADTVLPAIGVRLVAKGTIDTVARATTNTTGDFTMTGVPVGHYVVVVDTGSVGDSVDVVRIDTSAVVFTPGDSLTVRIAISYPIVSVAAARALPLGTRAFIQGVSLNSFICGGPTCNSTFGDSLVHVIDSSGAIRVSRVKVSFGNSISAGDSVRMLGTRAIRDGQPVWDNATPILIQTGLSFPPFPVDTNVTTNAQARTAAGGAKDAAMARIAGDTIVDTVRVVAGPDGGSLRLTTYDGTDTLVVLLDSTNAFPSGFAGIVPGAVKRFTGLLVPAGPGLWVLKPRGSFDIQ